MIGKFLVAFSQAKARALGQGITNLIVRFDPETASEAQILEYEKALTDLTTRVAGLRTSYRTEQAEADACAAKYNKYLAAADVLQKQLADATDDGKKAAIEASLTKLVGTLEQLKPELAREKKEADDAKDILAQFEDAAAQMAQQVVQARGKLKAAVNEMASAKLAKERAAENAENAAVLAGVRQQSDTLNTALNAMKNVAAGDRQKAEAGNLKAELLHKATPGEVGDDANIADALKQVGGEKPTPTNIADRLAALRA